MTATALYLGLDLGTSGCRGVAIDGAGGVHAWSAVNMPPPSRQGVRVEQDPGLWWRTVCHVTTRLVSAVRRDAIRAVAVDGTSGSILLSDASGNALGPALMYNDARAVAEAALIGTHAPGASAAHGASSALAKLLWLQAHGAKAARATRVLNQADWIAGQLRGDFSFSDENNSLKLGYDPILRQWPDWLAALGIRRELLPLPVAPGTALGRVERRIAHVLGLPEGTLVVAGTTDSVAAFLAAGAADVGEAVTSLGSTLVVKVLSDRPVFAPEYGVYSHRLGDRWLAGGASNSGGAVLTRYFPPAELQRMTKLLQPNRPTGLDYYPLCQTGERFPINDPHLSPRLTPRPRDDVQFLQGILEGIARIEATGYRVLARLGAPYPTSVRTTGGGACNRAWTQIREKALGVPLTPARHEEAAYGAALLALQGFTRQHPAGSGAHG